MATYTILAADTSTTINTVALCQGTVEQPNNLTLLAESTVECNRLHSERLIMSIDALLEEAGIALSTVNLLAVSIGPGSFTGLRIGAATLKGFALAQNIPLMGVPTLDAMARIAAPFIVDADLLLCPMLDARMREIFAAIYRVHEGKLQKCSEDQVCSAQDFAQQINQLSCATPVLFGDGVAPYRDAFDTLVPQVRCLESNALGPRAWGVAAEALARLAQGLPTDAALVEPIYLRKSQAEINRERQNKASAAT